MEDRGQKKRHKPELMFSNITTDWEGNALGEICEIGDIDHRMPKSAEYGFPYIMTGDFYGINSIDFENSKLISEEDFIQLSKKIKPEFGDILFARYASIGAVRYVETHRRFLVSYSCAILKHNNGFSGKYLYYYFQSDKGRKKIELDINTGSQGNVGIDSLKKMVVNFPNRKAQDSIGDYLSGLDRLLTSHEKKHNKLLTLKKAMLEKMFPRKGQEVPEIRFKGFEGKWEKEGFTDIFVGISNNSLSRSQLNHDYGRGKNIHYGDVLVKFGEILNLDSEELPYISNDNLVDKMWASRLQDGDIIVADAAEDQTVGKCLEVMNVKDQIVFSGLHTIALRPQVKFALKYLGYYMNSFSYHGQLLSLMQGTKVLSISKSAISNTLVHYPKDKSEQEKIGSYFSNLDHLIAQHQSQLTKLKHIKKAMLEKMFM